MSCDTTQDMVYDREQSALDAYTDACDHAMETDPVYRALAAVESAMVEAGYAERHPHMVLIEAMMRETVEGEA
jgi:hypothetical protein